VTRPAPRTFFGAPGADAGEARVVFLGVPFDGGTPQPGNRTGQAAGPAAVRARSFELFEAGAGFYDVETDRTFLEGVTMADAGDVAVQGGEVEPTFERMRAAAGAIVARRALLVAVGGDHSMSFPLVRGVAEEVEVDVVHVDAHADFLDDRPTGSAGRCPDGARLTGASQLRRISELERVRTITALGLRNVEREEIDALCKRGARWATSLELERDPTGTVERLVPASDALYLSLDLDVLDGPLVPGTTLPEPGGPGLRQLRDALTAIARRGRVVAVDLAELNPPHDPSGITARVAAWLLAWLLAAIFEG
jgi:agmatinase